MNYLLSIQSTDIYNKINDILTIYAFILKETKQLTRFLGLLLRRHRDKKDGCLLELLHNKIIYHNSLVVLS